MLVLSHCLFRLGKTTYLYLRLIDRLLDAKPTYFQTEMGDVFFVDKDGVRHVRDYPNHPPKEIVVALVDADKLVSEPDGLLTSSSAIRIIVTSSPKNTKDRKWLSQLPIGVGEIYLMDVWSSRDLFVAGLALCF